MKRPRFTSLFTNYHLLQWAVNLCDRLIESVSWAWEPVQFVNESFESRIIQIIQLWSGLIDSSDSKEWFSHEPSTIDQSLYIVATDIWFQSFSFRKQNNHKDIWTSPNSLSLFCIVVILVTLFFICSLSCLVDFFIQKMSKFFFIVSFDFILWTISIENSILLSQQFGFSTTETVYWSQCVIMVIKKP